MHLPSKPHRLARRLVQLYAGLLGYGISMALMVEAGLGNQPWDVLHQGAAGLTGISIGTVAIVVGALVLLCWIPLRQRPGLGTISNILVIGPTLDIVMVALPTPHGWALRVAYLLMGIVLCGFASGLYIGANLGPGPRDGLMTGLAARGYSVRVVRTAIEITVVAIGFLLGGVFGLGTLLYAVTIGPLAHVFIPMFTIDVPGKPSLGAPREPDPALPAA
ncbi:putative membrane protein YczE [Allocatelliglobosispora scoriae]|uniref:Putative membrane protein YczE n=1 Tax=Allocatelliglobosispora scoriae TaxID=643052 RepID=A0A841BPN5_9ACTN|nr:hypothetical protein [Allocatelliglobosispora scoriae]MBB5869338.1 putative membrane protein YczE [Allocatelliglobosispora scoriae]